MTAQGSPARASGARAFAVAAICAAGVACASGSASVGAPSASEVAAPRPAGAVPELVVRNNHEIPYRGAVEISAGIPQSRGQQAVLRAVLPDGRYAGEGGVAEIRDGVVRAFVELPASGEARMTRTGAAGAAGLSDGPLSVVADGARLALRWAGANTGDIDIGLVVIPGTIANVDSAIAAFTPLPITWTTGNAGTLNGTVATAGYSVELTVTPYGAGSIDAAARITRRDTSSAPAYFALVRRVAMDDIHDAKLRFNGRVFTSANSPDIWDRDFWYTHGVDWLSWRRGPLSFVGTSAFAAGPTVRRNDAWHEGSHFYVWERTRASNGALYMVSEIAGPNPDQAKPKSTAIMPYAPLQFGDTVRIGWRLGIAETPGTSWEESQLRGFAGYVHTAGALRDTEVVDIGVRGVSFGTSYFPYSTFAENFDYYRTPGLDRETYWPFSPALWTKWRQFTPRMATDLHIIRAMGFDWVRLHHVELIQGMDRSEALAFLDWYTAQARALGLKVLVDTEGPDEWVSMLMSRYGDVVKRLEIENEVLIPGITPGEPERWSRIYEMAKRVGPADLQAFLTDAGNHGQFERLRALGVPFDRVGLHAYKHGPQWKEALGSHTLGTGGYATSIGREATLGEFNWKNLTELSPEERAANVDTTYRAALAPRAIPEVFEFHFQETLDVNPAIGRSGVRHYEPLYLDRRLKPEGRILAALIRQYASPDAPISQLEISAGETRFVNGAATGAMRLTNRTTRALSITADPQSFDGTRVALTGDLAADGGRLTLAPRASRDVPVALTLPSGARPGTYHYFLRAAFDTGTVWGWGVAANAGEPSFNAPLLGDAVRYERGAEDVKNIDWSRPLGVAFGGKMPILEMEMAYAIANTLQAATGRPVRLSGAADVPDSLLEHGTLFLVGTPATNPLVAKMLGTARASAVNGGEKGRGVVIAGTGAQSHWIAFTGSDKTAAEAAAADFILRYWPNAKDAALRLAGMERGAALGNKAGVTTVDPP